MSGPHNDDKAVFSVKFHPIPDTKTAPFLDHFTAFRAENDTDSTSLIRSDPGGFVFTNHYEKHAEKVFRFEPRKSDVWVVTFPKCGTTWTQELVWLLTNNCDYEAAKVPLVLRAPFLEMPYFPSPKLLTPDMEAMAPTIEDLNAIPMDQKRVIKCHLPFYLLHPQLIETSKVVYVARNPKDVIVSYYHHHKLFDMFHGFTGDLEDFANYFMEDRVLFAPFFPHVLDGWAKKNHPNVHFMFYEDLKKDLKGEVQKVATFLGRSLNEEELEKLTSHLKFQNIASNPAVNWEAPKETGFMRKEGHFIRKGKTGDWKNHFSPELNEKIDKWIEKNMAGSDLHFVTELAKQD